MDQLNILQRLGQGRLLEELTAALANVADEVVASGKPGQVVLTLKITTRSQGDPQIVIEETVARKLPARAARGAVVYAIDGTLYTRDPRQQELRFETVPALAPEVRSAGSETVNVRNA